MFFKQYTESKNRQINWGCSRLVGLLIHENEAKSK